MDGELLVSKADLGSLEKMQTTRFNSISCSLSFDQGYSWKKIFSEGARVHFIFLVKDAKG